MWAEMIKEKSRKSFNEIAEQGIIIKEPSRCYDKVMQRIPENIINILDIGCGEGYMLNQIQELCTSKHLYGIDISEKALEKAKERCGDAVSFIIGDSEELPYQDGFFDLVLCMHSFHHYPNPRKVLAEMNRVLKQNGEVFIVENDMPAWNRILNNISHMITLYYGGDVRKYSSKKLMTMAKKYGFRDVESVHVTERSYLIRGVK